MSVGYLTALITIFWLWSLVSGIDPDVFDYKPLCNYNFTPAVPVQREMTNGDAAISPSFIIVIPYTKSYLLQFPESNRTIQSWREYATLHGYQLRLVDATPIIKEHGQSLFSSVEKRHGNIYVTGKPLVALVTFRSLSLKESIHANTWMVFVDMDTMVANPYYRLEDLIAYANNLGQQDPKQVFEGHYQNQTSGNGKLSSITRKNVHVCHMVGQLGPSTINSGFLLFPFTTTAQAILQDWAQQTLEHSLRNEDWQGDQGIMQLLVLKHLQQILMREYRVAQQSDTELKKNSNRKLVGAKKPAQVKHKSVREHQLYREKTGEKLNLQYHKRQEQRLKDTHSEEYNKPSLLLDSATEEIATSPGEAVNSISFWNILFGSSSSPTDSAILSNNKDGAKPAPTTNKIPMKKKPMEKLIDAFQNKSSISLPHGGCIEKGGNVARGHCFGRTMRDLSVFWDNARTRPFCLLSAQSSIGIFNVHDWPLLSEDYGVVAAAVTGGVSQYAINISPVSPAMAAMPSYYLCHHFYPPFYHGKNTSLIHQIPLWSELSTSQKWGLQRYYQQVLDDSHRTDKQRVFPRTTLITRTECDHFWKHILVRHIDDWDTSAVSSVKTGKFAAIHPVTKRKRNIP